DGIDQIETISKQLMRGIEVSLDSNELEIPVSQTATFTFNVTSLGFLDVVFETGIDEIPEGWSAEFAPNKLSMKENETKEVELRITPNENVVPGVWETFFVEIFWSDYEDNDIDDLRREFAVTVDPIEQPEPDFTIETGDFVWTPDYPTVGTEVTISATLTNLVNYSGAHYVPVVFYANDEPIKMVTAEFDGNNSEVTVSATWNATRGTHAIKAHIDPENAITEQNTDNNKASTTFSISETDEEENNSFTVIALAVGVLVAGFVYISYRSRR
ncbi:MAG: CARDB domain-containing protein, partial [Candidatus Thermoplasmatota archaeon]|nr:CARDB domain-containing protein [Candidatus Thermoplasmatota archaeon]